MRVLSTGIDTLNLAVKGVVRGEVWKLLEETQQRAALLPAYLGLYLGTGERQGSMKAIPRALAVSGVVTLSFVLLFVPVGLLLSAATSRLPSRTSPGAASGHAGRRSQARVNSSRVATSNLRCQGR